MVLTLIVVPVVYTLVARKSHSPEYVGQMIDKLMAGSGAPRKPGAPATADS